MTKPLYEIGEYWVCREDAGTGRLRPKTQGYAVYKNGITHAVRVAQIGFEGTPGMVRAIAEADRRHTADKK